MQNRIRLHELLEDTLESSNVYFQPPSSIRMKYPAIVYSLSDMDLRFANNRIYNQKKEYMITLIDKNPDSEYVDRILSIPFCSFDRHYVADNLHHYVYTIYY